LQGRQVIINVRQDKVPWHQDTNDVLRLILIYRDARVALLIDRSFKGFIQSLVNI
jgi:hypothetical protein